MQLVVQEKRKHPVKTKQGTNGSEERETCKICPKILEREPKVKTARKAKSKPSTRSTASAEDMAEFQKFLTWRMVNEK